jgi:hypothetical protein
MFIVENRKLKIGKWHYVFAGIVMLLFSVLVGFSRSISTTTRKAKSVRVVRTATLEI